MGSITTLATIGGVVAILTMVFTQLIANKFRSKLRSQTKKVKLFSFNSMLYLASAILLLALPVLLSLLVKNETIGLMGLYIITALYATVMGILHIFTHYKYVKWAEKAVDLLPDILYTIVIALMATVLFNFIYQYITEDDEIYTSLFVTLLSFIIPMFVLKTVTLYNQIPELEYQTFKISEGDRRVAPGEIRNAARRKVVFHVNTKSVHNKREKIDATLFSDVEFGVCVYHILKEYNTRPELPDVVLRDDEGNEKEFIFYFKPKFLGIKKLIDPFKSVIDNRIGNKAEIVFHSIKKQNT